MATCKDCYMCDTVGCSYIPSDCDGEEILEMCATGKQDEIPNIEKRCGEFLDKDLVKVLPCKIGTTVYFIRNNNIETTYVEKVIFKQSGTYLKLACNSMYETSCKSIGKTVFFEKDKAQLVIKKC